MSQRHLGFGAFSGALGKSPSVQALLHWVIGALALLTITLGIACNGGSSSSSSSGTAPISVITPEWTIPAPPNATLNQSYHASVPVQDGCTYQWSVSVGSATLIGATTHLVTFTPTDAGSLQLQCVVSNASGASATGTYDLTAAAGATLNANPDSISLGQGTILLASFTGTTGLINPGGIPITTDVGITVSPTVTTTYTLNVDDTDVATVTVTVKTFVPKFVYVANDETSISAFKLNTTTGGLSEIAGSPYAVQAEQVVSDPDGKFLLAAAVDGVYVYKITASTGALTVVSGSPFVTDEANTTYSVAMDPKGRWVYASTANGWIYAFDLNASTGVLTPVDGSPFETGNIDRGEITVHPSGKYLYAALALDNQVDGFSIDQATGALEEVSGAPFDGGSDFIGPYGVAVDPTGAYFFAKGEGDPSDPNVPSYLAAYSLDITTGALSPVTNSPFGALTGSNAYHGLCFHPTLNVLYTAFYNSDSTDVGAYSLDLGTGALTDMAGSPYDLFSTHGSDNIVVDRSGQFAFAANYDVQQIKRMRVDGTGLLTKLDGNPLDGTQDEDVTSVDNSPISIAVTGALQALTE